MSSLVLVRRANVFSAWTSINLAIIDCSEQMLIISSKRLSNKELHFLFTKRLTLLVLEAKGHSICDHTVARLTVHAGLEQMYSGLRNNAITARRQS